MIKTAPVEKPQVLRLFPIHQSLEVVERGGCKETGQADINDKRSDVFVLVHDAVFILIGPACQWIDVT
jgi:hypothetical protein